MNENQTKSMDTIKARASFYQKLAKDIDKFEPTLDRIITINTLEPKILGYDYDKVIKLPPDSQEWITISKVYFNEPQYQRIILYYAALYQYLYYVSPVGLGGGGKINKKRLEKEYRELLDFLDEDINVESFALNTMITVLTEGAVFYYYDWVEIDGKPYFTLFKLPREYCSIVGKAKNNQLPIIQCDVSFIDVIISGLKSRNIKIKTKDILAQYPPEIREHYIKWKTAKGNNVTQYLIINPANGTAFTSYNGLPPFAQTLRQLFRIKKFEGIRDEYIDTSLQKILFQHVGVDKDGNPEVDLALAAEFHKNLKKVTKDIPRLNALTSLAEIEVLDLSDTSTKNDLDFIASFNSRYYDETGASQEIFKADTAGTLEYSAWKDESYMWGMVKQIEIWLNFIANAEIGAREKRLYNFVFSFLPVSYRNREKMMDSYLKNAQYGYSKLLPQIAVGVKQRHFESLLYLENDVLKLDERLVPLMSSHTMSGKESLSLSKVADKTNPPEEGGRPSQENSDKTDGTLAKDASK